MQLSVFGAKNGHPGHKESFGSEKRQPLSDGMLVRLAEARRLHGNTGKHFHPIFIGSWPKPGTNGDVALTDAYEAIKAWRKLEQHLQDGTPEKGEAHHRLAELYDMRSRLCVSMYGETVGSPQGEFWIVRAYQSSLIALGHMRKAIAGAKETGVHQNSRAQLERDLTTALENVVQMSGGILLEENVAERLKTKNFMKIMHSSTTEARLLRLNDGLFAKAFEITQNE